MIEAKIIQYLISEGLSIGTNVYAERPKNIPPYYVVIEKTGSSTDNMITTSTIAIQSVADSLQGGTMLDAISINDEIKDAMFDFIEDDEIVRIGLNSDYNYTDDSTKEYRYQAVFEITHY